MAEPENRISVKAREGGEETGGGFGRDAQNHRSVQLGLAGLLEGAFFGEIVEVTVQEHLAVTLIGEPAVFAQEELPGLVVGEVGKEFADFRRQAIVVVHGRILTRIARIDTNYWPLKEPKFNHGPTVKPVLRSLGETGSAVKILVSC
jgi:hypothetical protein